MEQFSAQVHIFSYRAVDFNNCIKFVQSKLNSADNQIGGRDQFGRKRVVGKTIVHKDLHE